MNTCKYCGKPLTLTPEYDICMECQGRIMRESTIPQGAFATNSTHPQMITHEEAKTKVTAINGWKSEELEKELLDYITQQQAKDQAHEELKRDVKRYFELDNKHGCTLRDIDEWLDLERKLMKVGKKDV